MSTSLRSILDVTSDNLIQGRALAIRVEQTNFHAKLLELQNKDTNALNDDEYRKHTKN
jgi:hypothetical protein